MAEGIKSEFVRADSCDQGTTRIFDSSDFDVPQEPEQVASRFTPKAPVSPPETKQASGIAPKQGEQSGGTHRVALSVPVLIRGALGMRGAIREEARTVSVCVGGAVIALEAGIPVGARLTLINLRNGAESECRVSAVERREEGHHAEVEFTQQQPQFWPVSFPPDSSDAAPCMRSETELMTAPASESKQSAAAYFALDNATSRSDASRTSGVLSTSVAAAPGLREHQLIVPTAPAPKRPTARHANQPGAEPENLPYSPVNLEQPQIDSQDLFLPPKALRVGLKKRDVTGWLEKDEPSRRGLVLVGVFALLLVAALAAGRVYLRLKTNPIIAQAPANDTSQLENGLQPGAAAEPQIPSVTPLSPDNGVGARTPEITAASLPQPAEEPVEAERPQPVAFEAPATTEKVKPNLAKLPVLVVPRGKPAMPAAEPLSAPPNIPAVPGGTPSGSSNAAMGMGLKLLAPRSAPKPALRGDVSRPQILSVVRPVYPPAARASRVQGDVVIQADIDTAGNVAVMKVLAGPLLLQQAALDALGKWKYVPGKLDGEPAPMQIVVTIRFHLQ